MVENRYNANELVMFAKYVADKSKSGRYLMIGFLNNDGTRFKHIASGKVYDIKGACIGLDRPGYPGGSPSKVKGKYETPAIEDMGQAFIQVEPTICGVSGEYKSRFMLFSAPCVFSKVYPEPLREYNGRVGYPNLYTTVEKMQDKEPLKVSGVDLFQAEREATFYATSWLYGVREEDNSTEPFLNEAQEDQSYDERDF